MLLCASRVFLKLPRFQTQYATEGDVQCGIASSELRKLYPVESIVASLDPFFLPIFQFLHKFLRHSAQHTVDCLLTIPILCLETAPDLLDLPILGEQNVQQSRAVQMHGPRFGFPVFGERKATVAQIVFADEKCCTAAEFWSNHNDHAATY